MKILEWMQKKLNGSNGRKKPNSISTTYYMLEEPRKQEFSDWPQALLVIGTFGNSNLKEDSDSINPAAGDSSSSEDCSQEFTFEVAGNLQNELKIYFPEHTESNWVIEQKEDTIDEINQRLNNEHSSLKVEGKENKTSSDGYNNFYPYSRLSKSVHGKKSLVFLLKKMFVCRSGFPPTPCFKDQLSTESRIEKILRAIFRKTLHPQGSSSAIFIKKYLKKRHMPKSDNDDEELVTDTDNGSKWDKTDSEYIVLEI